LVRFIFHKNSNHNLYFSRDDEIDGAWEAPRIDNPLCKDAPGCGEWTAPMIPNRAYKGIWRAPLVENPNYRVCQFSHSNHFQKFPFQGVWEPRKIANPDYFEESHPYKLTPIGSLALELWSMVDGVVFDNFLITSDQSIAKQYDDQIWYPKSVLEGKAISAASESVVDAIVKATKDRPWLWAVYLVAILLPIIILFVFCWSRKSTKKTTTKDGLKKKTDAVEPDSNEQQVLTRSEEDDETEEIEIDEQQIKRTVTNVGGKDALENEEEEQEEQEQEEDDDDEVEINVRRLFLICF
jgi:calnexin